MVIIGLDPYPDSHTVAALDESGTTLASLTVLNDAEGLARLHQSARSFPEHRWAVEGAANRYILPFVCELLERGAEVHLSRAVGQPASLHRPHGNGETMNYTRFAAMIATSTVVMFGLMYLNTYALNHVFFSETRAYMALYMGAAMAVIMLGYMLNMYKSRRANIGIFVGSIAVFALSLWLVRSQATVGDIAWMKAMIPHHSIAILTSERANISDPRVRDLADTIIQTQRKEIAEMKALIQELENQ
jgi:hypothetical protein